RPVGRRVAERHGVRGGPRPESALALAGRLVRLFRAVHRVGLVLVDVSPNNVVIDPAGGPWLVDLDAATEAGQPVYPVGTPRYTPPEDLAGGGRGGAPRPPPAPVRPGGRRL